MERAQYVSGDGTGHEAGGWPAHQKAELVLSILTGASTVARAAAAGGVPETEVREWRRHFISAGTTRLRTGAPAPEPGSIRQLRSENEFLRAALHGERRQVELWRASAGSALGPFAELEAIRLDAAMSIRHFCALVGVPRRSYHRRLALLRSGGQAEGRSWPAPSTWACIPIVAAYRIRWPEYGHRRLHAAMAADGHVTSPSTVLRAMRLLGGTAWTERRGDADESESRHTD